MQCDAWRSSLPSDRVGRQACLVPPHWLKSQLERGLQRHPQGLRKGHLGLRAHLTPTRGAADAALPATSPVPPATLDPQHLDVSKKSQSLKYD